MTWRATVFMTLVVKAGKYAVELNANRAPLKWNSTTHNEGQEEMTPSNPMYNSSGETTTGTVSHNNVNAEFLNQNSSSEDDESESVLH